MILSTVHHIDDPKLRHICVTPEYGPPAKVETKWDDALAFDENHREALVAFVTGKLAFEGLDLVGMSDGKGNVRWVPESELIHFLTD